MRLRKLEQKREKSYAPLQEVKSERETYDQETERLRAGFTQHRHIHPEQYAGSTFRPREGTEAAELERVVEERLRGPNPHQEAYEKALAAFHAADVPCEDFKRRHVRDRLAETEPAAEQALAKIRAGAETLLEGCQQYRAVADATQSAILDTPGLNGTHAGFDPVVNEVDRLARQIVGTEIRPPGLTDAGERKATEHGAV